MKNLFLKIRKLRAKKRIIKNVTLLGENYTFNELSNVVLNHGSDKKDIILGNNIKMYGKLLSQNHAKIICGDNVTIGANTTIYAVNYIKIEKLATISYNVTIMDNNNHPINPEDRKIIYSNPSPDYLYRSLWRVSDSAPVIIGENTWVGANSVILKGVTIGKNSIVGIGSVVTKNVPANCIVAGNPAVIVKRNINTYPRKLKNLQ